MYQLFRRFTYLPCAEVKRSSERGAAISLPLPIRARALESAAVASRIMDADRNGAVFTSNLSSTASRKVATFGFKPEEGHSSIIMTKQSHNGRRGKPVSFTEGLLYAPPSAFVSRQQGKPLPSYSRRFDTSARVLHQKHN
ncbi:Hypothetical predicted protein [Xyrichtys novacula]|uniref:Uncharacterized protein n=1 Tax=Xyrichtys novacula TaxID=13765 RepID=A0AAV1HLS6_XYRNO|nr:Hypothetical predicted protein [Xyrichtys novacula]